MWLCSFMRLGVLSQKSADLTSTSCLPCSLPSAILLLKNLLSGQGQQNSHILRFQPLIINDESDIDTYFKKITCSILSRYGVHGFPTLFLLNSTMRVRYHGSRTINSLVAFYSDVTGKLHQPFPTKLSSYIL